MLAYADTPAPDFPYAGAAALWQGNPVTIHQRTDDGQALIFGLGISARVDLGDLSPATGAGLFAEWVAERITPEPTPFCRSDETDLFVDYACWLERQGYDRAVTGTRRAFTAALADAGYLSSGASRPGLIRNRRVRFTVWHLTLIGELS